MRVLDGVANLTRVIERPREIQTAFARDHSLERVSGHVFHDDEEQVRLPVGRDDRHDVRMAQRGEQARLSQQIAEVDVLPVGNFEGDFLVDPRVFGEVHRAESAASERRQDFVLSDDLTSEKHWWEYTA